VAELSVDGWQPNEDAVLMQSPKVVVIIVVVIAPHYTTDCCIHTSDIARRQHLRSAGCHQLFVPRHLRSMFSHRAFSVAGPVAWNSLTNYLRDPSRSFVSFHRDLKTSFLFLLAYTAHWRLCDHALYKSTTDDNNNNNDNDRLTAFDPGQPG